MYTLDDLYHLWQKSRPLLEEYGYRLLAALILVLVGLFLLRIILKILRKTFQHTDFNETIEDFIVNLCRIGGKIVIFLIGLATLGVNIGPLIASLGVAGFIVGFALKDTLSNLAAGVMIMFYRPFEKGDSVELLGGRVKGQVRSIDVPATILESPDGKMVLVPNSRIWGDVILNHTKTIEELMRLEEAKKKEESKQKTSDTEEKPKEEEVQKEANPSPAPSQSKNKKGKKGKGKKKKKK